MIRDIVRGVPNEKNAPQDRVTGAREAYFLFTDIADLRFARSRSQKAATAF